MTRADGIALAVLGVLAVLLLTSPAAVISDVPFDVFIPLDGAFRWTSGQWPHLDFHTPVGALYYALYGVTMSVMGPTEAVLLVAPVVAAIPVVAALLYATVDRLDPGPRALVVLFGGLTAFSPRVLDAPDLAFLASYNRIGWALVIAGLLLLLLPRPKHRSEWADGAVLTVILLALFFLKITYFGVVGLGCGLALAVVPDNRRVALGAGIASWVVIGLLFALWELPWAYVADLQRAVASDAPGNERTGSVKLLADLLANAPALVLTLAMLGGAARSDRSWQAPAATIGVLVLGLATAQQSHDHAVPALIVAVALAARHLGDTLEEMPLVPTVGVALVVLTPVLNDGVAILRNAQLSRSDATIAGWPGARVRYPGSAADLKLDQLNDGRVTPEVYFLEDPPMSGADLALLLTEGQDLVGAKPGDSVLTLNSSPAFTWLSQTRPPRGIDAWYDYGRTFGPDRPIDPVETLADVTIVMDPIGLDTPTIDKIREDLQPALEAEFTPHETPLWRIWFRR